MTTKNINRSPQQVIRKRNGKVECDFNMVFSKHEVSKRIEKKDVSIVGVSELVSEKVLEEIGNLDINEQYYVKNIENSKYAIKTDIDPESFETSALKKRKTIRFSLNTELTSRLYFGYDQPERAIFAYIYCTGEQPKLSFYSTSGMKSKSKMHIVKFDIFNQVKYPNLFKDLYIGLVVVEKCNDQKGKIVILNGTKKFVNIVTDMGGLKRKNEYSPTESSKKTCTVTTMYENDDSESSNSSSASSNHYETCKGLVTLQQMILEKKFKSSALYLSEKLKEISNQTNASDIYESLPESELIINLLSKLKPPQNSKDGINYLHDYF